MDDEIILFDSSNPADLAPSTSSAVIESVSNKGKEVIKSQANLTSPSLDDLNAKAQDT
jgi:hypothetical protein